MEGWQILVQFHFHFDIIFHKDVCKNLKHEIMHIEKAIDF